MKQTFILAHSLARQRAIQAIQDAPQGHKVTIQEQTRSLDQNAACWPLLHAIAEQVKWPVNGQMVNMTAEEFKDVLTASFRKEVPRLAMGVDGGVVMLGQRTSKFTKKEFSEWLDYLHWFCSEKGVNLE